MIQSGYGNKEAVLEILYVKKILFLVLSSAEYICESGIVSMGEEKYYKNDCLKIIMDIYKALGSIRKLLVIIQMTKGQSAPLLFFRVVFNYTIMCFMFFIIRNSNK